MTRHQGTAGVPSASRRDGGGPLRKRFYSRYQRASLSGDTPK